MRKLIDLYNHYRYFLLLGLFTGFGRLSYILLFWVFAQKLSLEAFGIFLVVFSISQLFGMFATLGSGQALTVLIPQLKDKKDHTGIINVLEFALLSTIGGILFTLLLALITFSLPFVKSIPNSDILFKGLLWFGPIFTFSLLREAITRGFERQRLAMIPRDIIWALSLILIVFIFPDSLDHLFQTISITLIIIEIFAFTHLFISSIKPSLSEKQFEAKDFATDFKLSLPQEDQYSHFKTSKKQWFKRSLSLSANALGSLAFERLDVIMVAAIGGYEAAAVYGVANRFAPIISLSQRFVIPVILPNISKFFALLPASPILSTIDDDQKTNLIVKKIREEVKYGLKFLLLISLPLSIVTMILAPYLMGFFGSEYESGANILRVLVLAHLFITIGSAFSVVLTACPTPWLAARNIWVSILIMVILMYLIIPEYGAMGTAICVIIGAVIANISHFLSAIKFMRYQHHAFAKPNIV